MLAFFSQFLRKEPAVLKFPSPNKRFTKTKWVNMVVNHITSISSRNKIFLFDNFPPEYVDYYKALQEKIAEQLPDEQDRPFICLNIKGRSHLRSPPIMQNNYPVYANVGMAGGTGPLSDATALTNLISRMSGVPFPSEGEGMRQEIATRMQDFSGVMYSMPPPRDALHVARDAINYAKLYRKVRMLWPCLSLHILTNTGHSNKDAFNGVLGSKRYGVVDDMTVKVADRMQQESTGDNILILGTIQADYAQLYFKLLTERNLSSIYPEELYQNKGDPKKYLQKIIDQAKAGNVTKNMPGEQRTCGQAFIDFAVHYAIEHECRTLLFSCTELPMLLHTRIPGEKRTYLDKLEKTLRNTFPSMPCKFYDTEKIFVEEIARASLTFQTNPQLRSDRLQDIITSLKENTPGDIKSIKTTIKTDDFIIAGEENSFMQDVAQTFEMYDEIFYTLLKWSITVPFTLVGNLADLALFCLPKAFIDTSSCMQSFPFFRVLTRIKEDSYVGSFFNDMMNKGFGGLARCVTSIAIEVPISLVAVLIAAVLTVVHQLLAKTIGVAIIALGRLVQDNMCDAYVQASTP